MQHARDQVDSFEVESVSDEFYNRLTTATKTYFESRMVELEDIVRRSANTTNIRFLNSMIVGGDTAPLDAFVALSAPQRSFLLGSLEYDQTMREHIFDPSWSAAKVAGFIGEAGEAQAIGRLSDPTAGGGGSRFPHHLREHGPTVPDHRARQLAGTKTSGYNSRWVSFAAMRRCLDHAVTTLNASYVIDTAFPRP